MKSLFVSFSYKEVEEKLLISNKIIDVPSLFIDVTDESDIIFIQKKIEVENAVRDVKLINWKWMKPANFKEDK